MSTDVNEVEEFQNLKFVYLFNSQVSLFSWDKNSEVRCTTNFQNYHSRSVTGRVPVLCIWPFVYMRVKYYCSLYVTAVYSRLLLFWFLYYYPLFRYLGAPEAAHRMSGFEIGGQHPSVQALRVHLEDEQVILLVVWYDRF